MPSKRAKLYTDLGKGEEEAKYEKGANFLCCMGL